MFCSDSILFRNIDRSHNQHYTFFKTRSLKTMNDCVLAMGFAGELIELVLKHLPISFLSRKSSLEIELEAPTLKCVHSVGKSVLNLMLLCSRDIYECYRELTTTEEYQDSELGQLVLQSVPHYFPNGYTHDGFIAFCGMGIGVSVYYLLLSDQCLIRYMVGVVANVLTGFMLTGEFKGLNGWQGLECKSEIFNADSRRRLDLMSEEEFNIMSFFVFQKEINREELGV